MSLILHLETATKVCSVALSRDGVLIALKEQADEGYSHGENLTIFIQQVMNQADIRFEELSAVSIASGPGSYTGLRIGASTAKAICYACEIPLIAIDALTTLAVIAQKKYPNRILCPVIDARRMEVYNLILNHDLVPQKEISADIIDEKSYRSFEPFVCFGDGANKLQEIWIDRQITFDLQIHASASGQVKLAYEKFLAGTTEDVAYWEPFYLKDFIVGKK